MLDKNISFLEEFIGSEWLKAEFKKIDTKTPLKGSGIHSTYHPWVHYMYEIQYLLLRSDIENNDKLLMGRYYYIIKNAGMLLKRNIDNIINKKDAQMRLRNPEQFYDFMWELEVLSMLSQCGASAAFIDPKSGNTCDGSVTIANRPIFFECKNKVLDNDRYNTNSAFTQILAKKFSDKDVASIRNKIILIEFENARLEDVNIIVAIIRDKFDIYDYQSILGRYKIRTLKKIPFKTPLQYFLNQQEINMAFQINEVNKNEIFMDNPPSNVVKAKILIKMPDKIYELNNLNGVLKKANSQLSSGGIVFLQVPYETFESAKSTLEKEILSFLNIYAVKLISLNMSSEENGGIKVSHSEDLIISPLGKKVLVNEEIEFLSQPMAFSSYANRQFLLE